MKKAQSEGKVWEFV